MPILGGKGMVEKQQKLRKWMRIGTGKEVDNGHPKPGHRSRQQASNWTDLWDTPFIILVGSQKYWGKAMY